MKRTPWYGIGCAALFGLFVSSSMISAQPTTDNITVLCDHDEPRSKAEHSSNDGLSTIVRFRDKAILFDTGGASCALIKNLDELRIKVATIDAVVLSRNSSDHVLALAKVLEIAASQPKVYVPAPVPEDILQGVPQADVVAVSKPAEILPNAWLVGPLQQKRGGLKAARQVLVLCQPDGLVVYVGCSHSGVVSVVERVRETFGYQKIKLLAGGIHLRGTSKNDVKEISLRLQQLGVTGLALSRCTDRRALKIFRGEWGDRLMMFDRGNIIDLL